MDVKDEDKSEQSLKDHFVYYKSLTRIISEIQKEKNEELDPTKQSYLNNRIDAIEKDRQRIKGLFPNITDEEWDGHTN